MTISFFNQFKPRPVSKRPTFDQMLNNPGIDLLPMGGVFQTTEKAGFWGFQALKKNPKWIPKPSWIPGIKTTAKVAGVGTIAYAGYKGSQSIERLFETGSPFVPGTTKKENNIDTGGLPPGGLPEGWQGDYNYYAPPPGTTFGGGLGEGIGKGGQAIGEGIGNVLPLAVVGIAAYVIMTSGKEKKQKK